MSQSINHRRKADRAAMDLLVILVAEIKIVCEAGRNADATEVDDTELAEYFADGANTTVCIDELARNIDRVSWRA